MAGVLAALILSAVALAATTARMSLRSQPTGADLVVMVMAVAVLGAGALVFTVALFGLH